MKNLQKDLLIAFEKSGLTYEELAKRTNLPKSALYRYLNGDTEKIPIDRFQSLCNELHIDAGSLLGWKEEQPKYQMDLQLFGDDSLPRVIQTVSTSEARIISGGVDKMTPEERERALNIMRAAFAAYFTEESDNDT